MIKKLQIDLDKELYKSLTDIKKKSWRTLKFMLIEAVKEYIEKQNK